MKTLNQLLERPIASTTPSTELNIRVNAAQPSIWASFWGKARQILAPLLVNNSDPRVWIKTDRNGHTFWKAVDPTTGQSFVFDSEGAIREWIERRYYQ